MSDGKDKHAIYLVVDPIDNAPIPDAVTQMPGQLAGKAFDVVVPPWLPFQLRETAGELSRQRPFGSREEALSLRREEDLKHRRAPCAN